MSDPAAAPPPTTGSSPPPGRALGWFLAISGGIVLFLTLGCVLAFSDFRPFSEDAIAALLFGSPTLLLGGLFLWLGTRRLKR
jgi:hypothetical protein